MACNKAVAFLFFTRKMLGFTFCKSSVHLLRTIFRYAQNNLSRFFFGTLFKEIYRSERVFEDKNL